MPRSLSFALVFLLVTGLTACDHKPPAPRAVSGGYHTVNRIDFNRRAVELDLPLFWREDANANGAIDPDELAVLTGFPDSDPARWTDERGIFTAAFRNAYQKLSAPDAPLADTAAQKRHQLLIDELAQGQATLVETDLTQATPADKTLVSHLLNAARSIERIYSRQNGVFGMEATIPMNDTASQAVFRRNQSPYCKAPQTEKLAECSALAVKPPVIVGLYPAEIQKEAGFCDRLAKVSNAAALTGHFSTVVAGDTPGSYQPLPYTEAYRQDMQGVARELEIAAGGLGTDEAALKNYLLSAAASFRSNDWEPANAAWVAMNAQNSKWYVRVAPDEVYYDPCAWKAGFALQLARINTDSLEWQKKLDPLKHAMEETLAGMAGAPYKARDVNFRIPDFIDVVFNAGDQRSPHGATIGQSLPNWGPVAEKGGRTVAMTNLYTDPDSQARQKSQMLSLFCKASGALITTTPRESLIASLLHEAAHNLGPSHEYKVKGREDDAIFGGPLASTLEELKAQTSSMFLSDWLSEKGVLTADEAKKIQLRNVAWEFGHISQGMYTAEGTPRNYSQLSAIQLGAFMEAGAIGWRAAEPAANGTDKGCIEIDFNALPAAIKNLDTAVLSIKASGDKARAEQLKAKYVDADDDFAKVKAVITERTRRAPRASFVYSVKL